MKKLLTLLIIIGNFAYGQSTLILDKVKVYASGNTVPAVIFRSSSIAGLPLHIFCHGRGEQGTTGIALWNNGYPQALKEGFRPPYDEVMIAAQRSSFSIDPAWIPYIVADAVARFNIDTTRIYITGLSAGGWGSIGSVTNISQSFANKIAAVVALSASTGDVQWANIPRFAISKTSLWSIVGGSTTDATETSFRENNIALVREINKVAPGLAKIDIRPGVGHGGWVEIYKGIWKDAQGKTIWDYLKGKSTSNIALPAIPVITNPSKLTINVGTAFNYKVSATENPISFSATGLPAGITITNIGQISGTATLVGIFSATIRATNDGGTASVSVTFEVLPAIKVVDYILIYQDFTNPSCSWKQTNFTDGTTTKEKL